MKSALIALISAVLLYINTITIIKKIKKDENTTLYTIFGCMCICFILASIFDICGK